MAHWLKITLVLGGMCWTSGLVIVVWHTHNLIGESLFAVGVLVGIMHLVFHLMLIFRSSDIQAFYKVLLLWFLLAFSLLSGYILSILCWYRGHQSAAELLA